MKIDKTEKQWFAIRTKSHQEFVAKANFEQQGLQVYLPLIQKTRKHARKKELVNKPFFPGYLFVSLMPCEQRWETISSTRGTIGPVCFGAYIPKVPDWVIDSLRSLEDEKQLLQPKKILERKIAPGANVSVTLSGRKEAEGIFHSFHGKDRVVVLLDILNRQVKTVTSCSNIRI